MQKEYEVIAFVEHPNMKSETARKSELARAILNSTTKSRLRQADKIVIKKGNEGCLRGAVG